MKATKFKMTELGPIPEDWECRKIGEFAKVCTGNRNAQDKNDNGLYPFYVRSQSVERIDEYGFDTEGVITVGDGVGTGKVFHYVNGKFALHQRCYLIDSFDCRLDAKYFYKIFSELFGDRVMQMTAKSSVDSVRREMITGMQIPLPPLAEQRKIAEALSDIDELISALGKLIEKKRNIKTAAMQELLGMRNVECGMRNVPRRRLAGFSGEWVEKRLGDYAIVARGGSPRPIEAFLTSHNDGLNWVKIGDVGVGAKYIERTAEKILPSGLSSTRMVYPGDFLLSNSMSFGRPYIMKITGCIHDGWLVIQDYKTTFDTEYLYYVLGSEMVVNQYRVLAAGSSVLNLNKDVVASVTVVVPPTLAEQKAIAEVLSDMDAEIEALEAKRAKYESIKQGMMQELLTGKIRLV